MGTLIRLRSLSRARRGIATPQIVTPKFVRSAATASTSATSFSNRDLVNKFAVSEDEILHSSGLLLSLSPLRLETEGILGGKLECASGNAAVGGSIVRQRRVALLPGFGRLRYDRRNSFLQRRAFVAPSVKVHSLANVSVFRSEERVRQGGVSSSFVRWISSDHSDRQSDDENNQQPDAISRNGEAEEKDQQGEQVVSCSLGGAVEWNQASDEGERPEVATCSGQLGQGDEHILASKTEVEDIDQGLPGELHKDFLYRAQKARYKSTFEKLLLDWQDLRFSLKDFPYHMSENTKDLLVECAAAHLLQPKFATYGVGLPSSSRRVCLRGPAGTELYQERMVEALAHHLKASLLVLDSCALAPHDYGDQEFSSESDVEDSDTEVDCHEGSSGNSDNSDEDNEEESSKSCSAVLEFAAESVEEYKQRVLLQERRDRGDDSLEQQGSHPDFKLRKGDRVKYVGGSDRLGRSEKIRQFMKIGQTGRIVSVPKGHTGKVGVQFDERPSKKLEELHRPHALVDWCDLSDLAPDDSPPADPTYEWLAAIECLCEMTSPTRPLVVYFPDPKQWFERAVPSARRQEFLEQVEAKFDQLEGPIVLIASRTNEEETEYDDKQKLKSHLESIRTRLNLKTPAAWTVHEMLGTDDVYELFVNTIKIYTPKEEQQMRDWKKQLQYDKEISHARKNLKQLLKVLELHNMECPELSKVDLLGLNLTDMKAERVVGWARNHHLGLCLSDPPTNKGKLIIPQNSMEKAVTRLREQDAKKSSHVVKDYKTVAEDEYEKALITAVIPPSEVGVKFDHIGALENVKTTLQELVTLPLQRPELFSRGNLTRPCKGVLLFGPPGTGKTLLAKAVATEAGANFINITGSTITSKWFGDAEKLTKALFSLARKLSPSVIFVDEVDSLLGARGGSSEHEATRKTRNEFMAAWDGICSKDNERVLVLAATNRPFDLDDAVIRRLPRRILVDLPNAENRVKILRVILSEEELVEGFDFTELARITEGYSGSDLKNLSIAAAYRPIRELLESEQQQAKLDGSASGKSNHLNRGFSASLIRSLRLDDFKQAMTQVGASVAFDASSMNELRRWNEQYGEGGNRKKSSFGFVV
ncbi:hypothetical protein CY35_13G120300 [Sphagnum magellanicum]|nr:hypothetical protein CY35_13G120300 [Sphagnum magellanicum]